MSKGLFEARFLVIGDFLLSGFEMLLKDFDGKIIDLLISQVLDLLIHDPHNSLFLDADDIIDDDLLCGQLLLQLFVLPCSLALSGLAFGFFPLSSLSFILLYLHACLSKLEKWLLQFLLELVDLVLTDAPNVLLSVLDVLFGLSSDVSLIEFSLLFDQQTDIDEDFMELFRWVDLLSLVFED